MRACTRGPVCKRQENENRTRSIQGQRRQSDIPCAMAFTAYFALSPEYRAFLASRRLTETGTLARLGFSHLRLRLDANH